MKCLIILAGLLASACLPCEAFWFGDKNEPDESLDPVSRLSDILVQLTDDETLAANVDAALEHDWPAEFRKVNQPSFKLAVASFLELNGRDISDPINLLNAKQLRELAGENNVEFQLHKSKQRRVFRLLKMLENQLSEVTFDEFEDLWRADASREDRFQRQFGGLFHLDSLLSTQTNPQQPKLDANLRELSGAISLLKNAESLDGLKVDEVASVMAQIHKMKRYKNGLKLNAKVGLTAQKLLSNYLVEPCEALMKQAEVNTIFEPIKNLALHVDFDRAPESHDEAPRSWPMFWTSRYIFCKVLVEHTNLRELSEKLAKSQDK